MLSLEQCRKIDPELAGISDADVLALRDDFYILGGLAIERWSREKNGSRNPAWVLPDANEGVGYEYGD